MCWIGGSSTIQVYGVSFLKGWFLYFFEVLDLSPNSGPNILNIKIFIWILSLALLVASQFDMAFEVWNFSENCYFICYRHFFIISSEDVWEYILWSILFSLRREFSVWIFRLIDCSRSDLFFFIIYEVWVAYSFASTPPHHLTWYFFLKQGRWKLYIPISIELL